MKIPLIAVVIIALNNYFFLFCGPKADQAVQVSMWLVRHDRAEPRKHELRALP